MPGSAVARSGRSKANGRTSSPTQPVHIAARARSASSVETFQDLQEEDAVEVVWHLSSPSSRWSDGVGMTIDDNGADDRRIGGRCPVRLYPLVKNRRHHSSVTMCRCMCVLKKKNGPSGESVCEGLPWSPMRHGAVSGGTPLSAQTSNVKAWLAAPLTTLHIAPTVLARRDSSGPDR